MPCSESYSVTITLVELYLINEFDTHVCFISCEPGSFFRNRGIYITLLCSHFIVYVMYLNESDVACYIVVPSFQKCTLCYTNRYCIAVNALQNVPFKMDSG